MKLDHKGNGIKLKSGRVDETKLPKECDRTKPDHKGNEIKLKSGRVDETKLPKCTRGKVTRARVSRSTCKPWVDSKMELKEPNS